MNPVTGSAAEVSRLADSPTEWRRAIGLTAKTAERGAALWQAAVTAVQAGEPTIGPFTGNDLSKYLG